MTCGSRGDLADHAAQAFLNELFERPTGAVAGEHREVVNVNIGVAVRVGNFLVINFGEPVVCRYRAGVGKDQTAYRVGNGGVFLHAPVVDFQVVVHNVLVVQHRFVQVADLLSLFAVENVCFCNIIVAGLDEHRFHAVLNGLHRYLPVFDLGLEVGGHLQRKKVNDVVVVLPFAGVKRLFHSVADLCQVKLDQCAVSLGNAIHFWNSPFFVHILSAIKSPAFGAGGPLCQLFHCTIYLVVCQALFHNILCF